MRVKREQLARLETLDNGKPISEALWDIVSPYTAWQDARISLSDQTRRRHLKSKTVGAHRAMLRAKPMPQALLLCLQLCFDHLCRSICVLHASCRTTSRRASTSMPIWQRSWISGSGNLWIWARRISSRRSGASRWASSRWLRRGIILCSWGRCAFTYTVRILMHGSPRWTYVVQLHQHVWWSSLFSYIVDPSVAGSCAAIEHRACKRNHQCCVPCAVEGGSSSCGGQHGNSQAVGGVQRDLPGAGRHCARGWAACRGFQRRLRLRR